mmetsp:Transcript_50162/g.113757  ORF Transcript_50162/g.113757 Transcript_50162/m.113757 type:complete len:675 (+) Transcript_50162:305-2329(+)
MVHGMQTERGTRDATIATAGDNGDGDNGDGDDHDGPGPEALGRTLSERRSGMVMTMEVDAPLAEGREAMLTPMVHGMLMEGGRMSPANDEPGPEAAGHDAPRPPTSPARRLTQTLFLDPEANVKPGGTAALASPIVHGMWMEKGTISPVGSESGAPPAPSGSGRGFHTGLTVDLQAEATSQTQSNLETPMAHGMQLEAAPSRSPEGSPPEAVGHQRGGRAAPEAVGAGDGWGDADDDDLWGGFPEGNSGFAVDAPPENAAARHDRAPEMASQPLGHRRHDPEDDAPAGAPETEEAEQAGVIHDDGSPRRLRQADSRGEPESTLRADPESTVPKDAPESAIPAESPEEQETHGSALYSRTTALPSLASPPRNDAPTGSAPSLPAQTVRFGDIVSPDASPSPFSRSLRLAESSPVTPGGRSVHLEFDGEWNSQALPSFVESADPQVQAYIRQLLMEQEQMHGRVTTASLTSHSVPPPRYSEPVAAMTVGNIGQAIAQARSQDLGLARAGLSAMESASFATAGRGEVADRGGAQAALAAICNFPEDVDVHAAAAGVLWNLSLDEQIANGLAQLAVVDILVEGLGNFAQEPAYSARALSCLSNVIPFAPHRQLDAVEDVLGSDAILLGVVNQFPEVMEAACMVIASLLDRGVGDSLAPEFSHKATTAGLSWISELLAS